MSSRFQFVEDHRGAFGVKRLCRILAVSRSGFYRWLAGASARAGGRGVNGLQVLPVGGQESSPLAACEISPTAASYLPAVVSAVVS
ncbi:hypothetical protein [Streptomyces sp. NPDC096311]|uniref:hypothetical protein n=1 Tax=Streptomyces sp. NPDC096311 TaxID=3366083 RepID=UPI003828AB8F